MRALYSYLRNTKHTKSNGTTMKKFLVALASVLVIVPLLTLLFVELVAALVLACSFADGVQGGVGVLAVCCLGTIALALAVSRVCLGSSHQAKQLLRENTVALVGVVAAMLAIGSFCTLVGFGSFVEDGNLSSIHASLLFACLVEAVLCCMVGKRLFEYLKRQGSGLQELRRELRAILIFLLVLSLFEFCMALVGLAQTNVPIVQTLFEDLSLTYGDFVWVELILSCIKIAAAASGVIIMRRRVPKQAPAQTQTPDLALSEEPKQQSLDETSVLDTEAVNKALVA